MKSLFLRSLFHWPILIILASFFLSGCDITLFNPKGQIGVEQKKLIIISLLLMLIVVLPAIFMTLYFAWRYREKNISVTYAPNWSDSRKIEAVIWGVPCIIILILGYITLKSTYALDPRAAIPSDKKTITIQVIATDWKWVFLYPEQGIATVNEIAFPVNTPVQFKLTSYTVMNSFFIPRLGSQLYAMAGMENTLNLIANEIGIYQGFSSNYSGIGFSDMKFKAIVSNETDFQNWVEGIKNSTTPKLDRTRFELIAKPSIKEPVHYFSSLDPTLYRKILHNFMSPHTSNKEQSSATVHNLHSTLEE